MTRTAAVDLGSWATAVAAVPDEPTPIVADPIAAHRRDSDDRAEELSRGKASAGAGGDRGGSEGGQSIGRPLLMRGPEMAPHTPQMLGAPRRSRAAPRSRATSSRRRRARRRSPNARRRT